MFNEVIFFNYFHNGDLHLSRQFVREIMLKFPNYKYQYAHKHKDYILKDLNIAKQNVSLIPCKDEFLGSFQYKNILYLNTWYSSYKRQYQNAYGISFDTLYYIFDKHLNTYFKSSLGLLNVPEKFLPVIDYSCYKIENINNYLQNNQKWTKKILISNGLALSGQADNFNLTNILSDLAKTYPQYLFIYTNKCEISSQENLIWSKSIIGDGLETDLNENAYLSEQCDMVIGNSSGAYTFALTQNNLFNPKQIMISFSTIGTDDNKYWLGLDFSNKINYKCKIANYPIKKYSECISIINMEISKAWK